MSRLIQNQNIDSLLSDLQTITESQCSLSVQDLTLLNEAIEVLQNLKKKKGKTNEQILREIVKAVHLITKFFIQDF